jgi:hypothetical protein
LKKTFGNRGRFFYALKALRKLAQGWLVAPEADEGGSETTLGNSQKIIHPEGVAEILSRSRAYHLATRNDGAKGQRPPQGRAEAGLASPAGTGTGAATIVMVQRF